MNHTEGIIKRNILPIFFAVIMCLALASCDSRNESCSGSSVEETSSETDEYPIGYFKRVSIAKDGETYEEMLELLEIGKKGYLVVNDDGTAFTDLEGIKTEYTYDKKNFYSAGDTEMTIAFSYIFIGDRLVVNDGASITQYLKLTDSELEDYLEQGAS